MISQADYYWSVSDWCISNTPVKTISTSTKIDTSSMEAVDTTKFDIVEKKETKIARLKQELEESEIEWQAFDAAAKRYAVNLLEVEEDIKEIKEELAELENEPKVEAK